MLTIILLSLIAPPFALVSFMMYFINSAKYLHIAGSVASLAIVILIRDCTGAWNIALFGNGSLWAEAASLLISWAIGAQLAAFHNNRLRHWMTKKAS